MFSFSKHCPIIIWRNCSGSAGSTTSPRVGVFIVFIVVTPPCWWEYRSISPCFIWRFSNDSWNWAPFHYVCWLFGDLLLWTDWSSLFSITVKTISYFKTFFFNSSVLDLQCRVCHMCSKVILLLNIVPCAGQSGCVFIYFIYSRVYMLIKNSFFILLSLSPW